MAANKEDAKTHLFPVVGIGASAGGLKAIQGFFEQMPDNSGMAFIVIIHLAPDKTSAMDKLLQKCTSMNVVQVTGEIEIEPDHVYVISPNHDLSLSDNVLTATEKGEKREGRPATIDLFFRSLGKAREKKAIGVILSGTGADGTVGLRGIKEHGGISMAQSPKEAEYEGMPKHAIETDLVDFVLPVKKLVDKILDYKEVLAKVQLSLDEKDLSQSEKKALQAIFELVSKEVGRDFSSYKQSSILRRIERQMHITKSFSLQDYEEFLKKNPIKVKDLFKDLLISVTGFFRDPEAFKVLQEKIIPQIFEGKEKGNEIRVWCIGCATGEEAYSLAVLLHEYATNLENPPDFQVFATDIDEEAIIKARKGKFPLTIHSEMSEERLNRFFEKKANQYIIKKEIRERVLFAVHDLLSDFPFSKLDLISCRNLLIYFSKDLQKKVFNLLHYALRQDAYLFLGRSDSAQQVSDLFELVHKKQSIFKTINSTKSHRALSHITFTKMKGHPKKDLEEQDTSMKVNNIEDLHYKLLGQQHAPPSIIINEKWEVLHASEGIENYLRYTHGEPSRNLIEMVYPAISRPLWNLLSQFSRNNENLSLAKQLNFKQDGEQKTLRLVTQSIQLLGVNSDLIQVVFYSMGKNSEPVVSTTKVDSTDVSEENEEFIEQLELELKSAKEQLHITTEEYETSNEELKASNEELQSMNEELQLTTEELSTSKEELQEVNKKLEEQIQKVRRANNDLNNLMEATEIATIFVDRDINIQRYTSNATELFNIIPTDRGRPLSHITGKINYHSLEEDARRVLRNIQLQKTMVTDKEGNWYVMRLRPYRTGEDKIEGVVFTFVDVTELQQATDKLQMHARQQEAIAKLSFLALEENTLQPVLDEAVTIIAEILDVDFSTLYTLTDENTFVLKAATGWRGLHDTISVNTNKPTQLDYTLDVEDIVVTENYKSEKRFKKPPLLDDSNEIVSSISVAVKGVQDEMFGVIAAFSKGEKVVKEQHQHFMQVVANLLGDFIKRIRAEHKLQKINEELEQRIKARTKQLEEINTKLQEKIKERNKLQNFILEMSENERWEIGEFLHNELGQPLIAIEMFIQSLHAELEDTKLKKELAEVQKKVQKVNRSVYKLSYQAAPIDVEEGEVGYAFEDVAQNAEKIYDCLSTFKMKVSEESIKNIFVATQFQRIAQEAVKNACVHAKADNVTISLFEEDSRLYLTIEDNGTSFEELKKKSDVDIKLMEFRIEAIDGTLEVKKAPTKGGTLVKCSVSMEKAKQEKSFKEGRVKI
ncbi:MAG: CheR family methyltransferase [Balneolaceae bacterium]